MLAAECIGYLTRISAANNIRVECLGFYKEEEKEIQMKQKNKILCAIVASAAIGVMTFSNILYFGIGDLKQDFLSRMAHIPYICVPAIGITRNEMLQRFDGAQLYVLLEYDKERKGDIARWFYQIGESDIYFTFKYSYDSGKIEEWKMQKGLRYREWSFVDYL